MNKKTLLILLPVLALLGIGIGLYLYNKPVESLEGADAAETLEATALYQAFEADEASANQRFLGKIVQVSGSVLEVSDTDPQSITVTLEAGGMLGGVLCRIDPAQSEAITGLAPGQSVTLKGECAGYLSDVELVRCVPVN